MPACIMSSSTFQTLVARVNRNYLTWRALSVRPYVQGAEPWVSEGRQQRQSDEHVRAAGCDGGGEEGRVEAGHEDLQVWGTERNPGAS